MLGHPERAGKKKIAYSVVSRGTESGYAIRNQHWRYGKWPNGEELYHLTSDPEEKVNLAGNENQQARLDEFRIKLQAKQAEALSRR